MEGFSRQRSAEILKNETINREPKIMKQRKPPKSCHEKMYEQYMGNNASGEED
jgi:hypothetical protein